MTRLRDVLPVSMRAAAGDIFLQAVIVRLLSLPGHELRLWVLRHLCGWSIGADTTIERGVRVLIRGGVTIGKGCIVNRGVTLDGRGRLDIGDSVNISPEVTIFTADHDPDSPSFEGRRRPVEIGSRAWLAARALVLPGSTIGVGSIVAAGAVVVGEVPPYMIVAGVPARPVRTRPSQAQQRLPEYRRWWY